MKLPVSFQSELCTKFMLFGSYFLLRKETRQDKTKQNKQQYGNKAIVMAKKDWGDANVTLKKIHLEFFFSIQFKLFLTNAMTYFSHVFCFSF